MADDTLSEKLSRRHIDLRLDDVPPGVVEAAKLHMLDSLGCLLAGSRLEPGKLAYGLAIASTDNSSSFTSTLFGAHRALLFWMPSRPCPWLHIAARWMIFIAEQEPASVA